MALPTLVSSVTFIASVIAMPILKFNVGPLNPGAQPGHPASPVVSKITAAASGSGRPP